MSGLEFVSEAPPPLPIERSCGVCSINASLCCGACKGIFYCGKEHQKAHWKEHKIDCTFQKSKKSVPASSIDTESTRKPHGANLVKEKVALSPSAWARGFTHSDAMYEWLVDCYRMRLDEDYVYSGDFRGIYDPDSPKESKVGDLIIFAALCKRNGVLPDGWDWSKFLKTAVTLVPYAFEKSDAQEKYGRESVLSGGRSLRATGEIVYASGVMSQDNTQLNVMYDEVFGESESCFGNKALLSELGGEQIWKKFKKDLKLKSVQAY